MILALFVALLLHNVHLIESFRISSFQTSRWNGGVQKNFPVKSLLCAFDEIPFYVPKGMSQTFPLDDPPLDELLGTIACNQLAWDEHCKNASVTGFELNEIVHKELANFWSINDHNCGESSLSINEHEQKVYSHSDEKPVRHDLDIKGQSQAINMIYAAVKDKTPISKHFLDTLNKVLVGHVNTTLVTYPDGQNHSMPCVTGEYRRYPILVKHKNSDRLTPDLDVLLDYMETFMDNCNTPLPNVDPIAFAATMHLLFMRYHPYEAGNERTGLLLMSFLLLKAGLPPVMVFGEQREKYLEALELSLLTKDPKIIIKDIAKRVYHIQYMMVGVGKVLVKRYREEVQGVSVN